MEQKKTSLQELHQRVMRKKHVTARIDQLIRQQRDLTEKVETLKAAMISEQADVTIHGDMRVGVDGFLQFADYFFDGLFMDWTVLEEIRHSLGRVKDTRTQVICALSQLTNLQKSLQQELDKETARKDLLIVGGEV